MTQPQYRVDATVSSDAVVWLVKAAIDDEEFSHRNYSLWQAKILAKLASMIREGYEEASES